MLRPFKVLKGENEPTVEGIDYTILLNCEHITSLKAINIVHNGNIIAGYWVRLLNGKKYKATRVPAEIRELLECEKDMAPMNLNGEDVKSTPAMQ